MDPAPQPSRHRLLERQLRAAARGRPDGRPDLDALLDLVSAAYAEQEENRRHDNESINLVSREVTELNRQLRQEAEARSREAARLNALLENASEAILGGTPDGTILSFNRAAEEMFGYAAQEVIGTSALSLFGEGGEDLHGLIQDRLLDSDEAVIVKGYETQVRRKDGHTFPAEFSLSRLKFDGEDTVIGFWRDLSAHKDAEAALRAARDEAEAANSAKSEFLAAMSHEIRTPLNGVLGMAAAMLSTALSPDQRRMLNVINESGQILMTLLSDILDLSKIEAGRMVFEEAPFDLPSSVQAVARLYSETAAAKGLAYEVEVDPSAQSWFVGDPTRYRQVLQNLVSNALKFTEAGHVAIRVSAEEGPDGVALLRTEVADTGAGISPEARGRLFRKFSQADASTTRRYGGSGLGLAISKQMVEAQDGLIEVESRSGEGSRFWFILPMRRGEARPPAPEATAAVFDAGAARVRILAAEDNKTNQMVLSALLAQADLDLVFADNGAEAVAAVRRQDFDLVLMDVQMPVMDGMAATRAIRALGGPKSLVPIIAVTADAMPEQVTQCRAAGMDGHVSKPLRPEALFAVIEDALSRPRAAAVARSA